MDKHNILENIINLALTGTKDSDQHGITLFSLIVSVRATKVLELGVRHGDTTLPMLLALQRTNGQLTSIDINPTQFNCPDELKSHWTFQQSDALDFLRKNNEKYDVIFIDDLHTYQHVKTELELLEPLCDKNTLIILHDLMGCGSHPNYAFLDGGEWEGGGPYKVVAELDKNVWEWSTIPVNHGLTILRKYV